MSDTSTPPPAPELPPAPPPARRDGCLTAFMVVAGIVLLFPGLCFLVFAGQGAPFALIGLILIGGAIFLFIRAATPPTPKS